MGLAGLENPWIEQAGPVTEIAGAGRGVHVAVDEGAVDVEDEVLLVLVELEEAEVDGDSLDDDDTATPKGPEAGQA